MVGSDFGDVAKSYLNVLNMEDGFDHASPYAAWSLGKYKVATANFDFSFIINVNIYNSMMYVCKYDVRTLKMQ